MSEQKLKIILSKLNPDELEILSDFLSLDGKGQLIEFISQNDSTD
jgi:hypothetical protein